MNPIEIAFSKLKELLRKKAARSFDTIAQALGDIISLFSVSECINLFEAAGYEAEYMRHACLMTILASCEKKKRRLG